MNIRSHIFFLSVIVFTARCAIADGSPARTDQQKVDVVGAAYPLIDIVRETKDADAKWRAIRALGCLRYKAAVPLFIDCLKDEHPYVRSNATRALCDMRIENASGPLLRLLETETNGGVIEQTSLALRCLNVREAVPQLKRLANHESSQTRIWILQAIGFLGSRADVPFLAKRLNAESETEQETAGRAIGNLVGIDFGFQEGSGIANPRPAIKRAQEWWEKNKAMFGSE
ncbi:MAG: HEAT repeat domain-containing protein [bacterium]